MATAQTRSTAEDTALALTLTGMDADADALTFRVTQQPMHGTLTGTEPQVVFTPAANYFGTDELTFEVSDGLVTSTARVSLTITPVNDAPVADAQQLQTSSSVSLTLTGSDVEQDALTFRVTRAPAHGALTGTAPQLTYAAELGYSGPDSFEFVADDATLSSAPALISIEVLASDAGVVDAGVMDAGVADAGVADAGVADAGGPDAGSSVDAGLQPAIDAGSDPSRPSTGCGCSTSGDPLGLLALGLALARVLVGRRRALA